MNTHISDLLSALEAACSYNIDSGLIKQGEFRGFSRHQGIIINKKLSTNTLFPDGYYPELLQLKNKFQLFDDHHNLNITLHQNVPSGNELCKMIISNSYLSVEHPVIHNQYQIVAGGTKDQTRYQFRVTECVSQLSQAFRSQSSALTTHPPCSITLQGDEYSLVAKFISSTTNKISLTIGEKVTDINSSAPFSHEYQPENLLSFISTVQPGQVIHVGSPYGTLMHEQDGLKVYLIPLIQD